MYLIKQGGINEVLKNVLKWYQTFNSALQKFLANPVPQTTPIFIGLRHFGSYRVK